MPLKRMFVSLLLDPETEGGEPVHHRIEIRMQDRIVVEDRGIPIEHQFKVGVTWAFTAMQRAGLIGKDVKYGVFEKRVITAQLEPEDVVIPPTGLAVSDDSASSSPSGSATPTSGG